MLKIQVLEENERRESNICLLLFGTYTSIFGHAFTSFSFFFRFYALIIFIDYLCQISYSSIRMIFVLRDTKVLPHIF